MVDHNKFSIHSRTSPRMNPRSPPNQVTARAKRPYTAALILQDLPPQTRPVVRGGPRQLLWPEPPPPEAWAAPSPWPRRSPSRPQVRAALRPARPRMRIEISRNIPTCAHAPRCAAATEAPTSGSGKFIYPDGSTYGAPAAGSAWRQFFEIDKEVVSV
eukprot:SAG31_NODE_54_length_29987_cov_4.570664_15_plen_158_part_00